MLYGREIEQRRLASMLSEARADRRSGALVLRGEAGIGKSALLEWAAEDAVRMDPEVRVLRATGFEGEKHIASAGLHQLLWPVRDRIDDLPAPQAAALRRSLGMDAAFPPSSETASDTVGSGISQGVGPSAGQGAGPSASRSIDKGAHPSAETGAVRSADQNPSARPSTDRSADARTGPSADPSVGQRAGVEVASSLNGVSRDLAQDRFLGGLAVLTLLSCMADEGPVLCLIDDAQWLDTASVETLLFAARRLAAEGVVMLFATREDGFTGFGLPEMQLSRLSRRESERLLDGQELAGLTPTARDRVLAEAAGNPLALIEFGSAPHAGVSMPTPLPVAERVTAAFRARIAALPEKTRLMLLIASAEGRGYLPATIDAGRLLGVELADLEEAERIRLVEIAGNSMTFRHPLIRSATYQGAPAARRLEVHRALGESATDPGCRARHLAAATMAPDEDVAVELEEAAERALGRTGYATAAALFQQSAELTPDFDARTRRLGLAAGAFLRAGRLAAADELAATAAKYAEAPQEQARLAQIRAAVEFERGEQSMAARLLIDSARHAAAMDVPGMLRTGATYAWSCGDAATVRLSAELLRAGGHDDTAVQGLARLVDGDYAHGLPLLAELITSARVAPFETPEERLHAITCALIVGDDAITLDLAVAEAARLRQAGLIGSLPDALQALAQVQITAGRHRDAEATAAEAITIARDTGMAARESRIGVVLARIAAIEGDEERLRALTANALIAPSCGLAETAAGLLDLGLGRYEAALRRLDEIAGDPRRHTSANLLAAADQVEAAVRAGQPDRAHDPLERVRAWADASGLAWVRAVSFRCDALVSDSGESYEAALKLHAEDGGRPFERARTELLYGEWLRRARRRADARVPLHSALEIFERLKAAPWADRARSELRATGESNAPASQAAAPDALDRLTPQELQVVRLAADGISSREIAAQLFLSPRTVEYHLYKAYPKLGVASRKELHKLAPITP
ncbi:LuxR C-terminal-related transcriptional regulator [Spirillospora sp. NPDC048911]|uniref:helix-turn-helix transcriptional regulator n=1 Tax=Spirillospora sp. NPDC048911 TaxID=3364527 RepID=UPI0037131C57